MSLYGRKKWQHSLNDLFYIKGNTIGKSSSQDGYLIIIFFLSSCVWLEDAKCKIPQLNSNELSLTYMCQFKSFNDFFLPTTLSISIEISWYLKSIIFPLLLGCTENLVWKFEVHIRQWVLISYMVYQLYGLQHGQSIEQI